MAEVGRSRLVALLRVRQAEAEVVDAGPRGGGEHACEGRPDCMRILMGSNLDHNLLGEVVEQVCKNLLIFPRSDRVFRVDDDSFSAIRIRGGDGFWRLGKDFV